MAKRATAKAEGGTRKKSGGKAKGSAGGRRTGGQRTSASASRSRQTDPVDALIKLLQSPLVIDLLAVGATAALAAITETRSGRAQGGTSGKTAKAAGKAAAAAIGRRLATEFEEIRKASKKSGESRKARAGAGA